MNWNDLNEYYRRALSKEMSVKEATDFVPLTWAMMKFRGEHRELWAEESDEVFIANSHRLADISMAIYKRGHDKE